MPEPTAAVLTALRRAQTFEEAATVTLEAMLDAAAAALAASPFGRRGRILRAMVHLRPEDGYRRLVVVERDGKAPVPANDESPTLPSASAWRWVFERGCPVAIDVNMGIETEAGHFEDTVGPPAVSHDTRMRLVHREVTHLLAIPLRAPGGRIDGMISVEADCRAAIGRPFVFASTAPALQPLTDVAELFLSTLPLRATILPQTDDLLPVVGTSTAGVVTMLATFARQEETVLVTGPTGSGKSRLARWCHARSPRRARPFEVLDLTAVPEDLQMAELLGWRKGAFTGAVKDTPGALARAEGGTLFIDEIDKLSLKAQAGLLRVLEEHRYRPLGDGETERTANVRFLVGTNAKLAERVRGGTFREDLYFRINVLPVHVPPLVERRDEIPAWAAYMLAQRQEGDPVAAKLTADAESVLCAQPWPGNLRQLDNIVRRAYAIAKMDEAEPGVALPVHAGHIRRALVYEEGSGRRSLIEALHMAAAAFVEEAIRRKASGEEALELDMAGAFRGFVLGTAVAREGSKEAALRLLGTEVKIQQRNQSRQWRLEMEAVARLCELLGEEDDTPFGPLDGQRRTP